MSEELKPCPFCGGRAVLNKTPRYEFEVFCDNPDCLVSPMTKDDVCEEHVVLAWNTRTQEESK